MSKSQIVKILGLIGALCTGAVMITSGDLVGGFGVIAASLSSANVMGQ